MQEIREFYQKYANDVYRFSLYLSGNFSDAEDITSETFVRALTSNSKLIANSVRAYLFVVARNIYLESCKKTNPEIQLGQTEISTGNTPEQNFQQNAELTKVLAFLLSVDVDSRSALFMRQEGMSYKDISSCLRISENSAKVKVYRIRQRLKKWREGDFDE